LSVCGQTSDKAVRALVDMGFENVSVSETENELVYVMENTAYRLNGKGTAKAIELIQAMGMPADKSCRLIFLKNNVPEISLYYHREAADSLSEASLADWKPTYELGDDWRRIVRAGKENSSLYKIDVVIYPELSLKNLVITQIYQVLFCLSPAIEVSLWNGMKLTAQVVLPIYNDGYSSRMGKVHPGFLTLQQRVRLPYNVWATLTAGFFNADRYGVNLAVFHPFKDERFSVDGRIAVTGTQMWNNFKVTYGTKTRVTWNLGGSFYWPRYNTQVSAHVEQYLYGEKGGSAELIRHFRYASIGFYLEKAQHAKTDGGFRFQVALPPYKYKRKGYIPRVTPSKNMGLRYDAGNELYYYKTFRANPGDNIMEANSFNPYFIKSELLNY
jgi:hypothetical protein